ncbi:MAG: hypothetical protein ACI4QA_07095 [Candidatus Spyradosoma sp.]
MANYLLECKIIGGAVSARLGTVQTPQIQIEPCDVFRMSNHIPQSENFGVLLEEVPDDSFSAATDFSIKRLSLDDNHQTDLNVHDAALFGAIFACRGSCVVLELDDKNQVVGFKTAF